MNNKQRAEIIEDLRRLLNNFVSTDMIKNFRVSTNNKDAFIIKRTLYDNEGVDTYYKFSIYELTNLKDFYNIDDKVYELNFKTLDSNDITKSSYTIFVMNTRYNVPEYLTKEITSGEDYIIDNELYLNIEIIRDMISRTHIVQKEDDEVKIVRNLINMFNDEDNNKMEPELKDPAEITNNNGHLEGFKWKSLFKYIRKQ